MRAANSGRVGQADFVSVDPSWVYNREWRGLWRTHKGALKGQPLPSGVQQNCCPTGMCAQHDLLRISRFLGENAYFKYCPTDFLKDHMSQVKHIRGTHVNRRMPGKSSCCPAGFPLGSAWCGGWGKGQLSMDLQGPAGSRQPAASLGTWMDRIASVLDMPRQGEGNSGKT